MFWCFQWLTGVASTVLLSSDFSSGRPSPKLPSFLSETRATLSAPVKSALKVRQLNSLEMNNIYRFIEGEVADVELYEDTVIVSDTKFYAVNTRHRPFECDPWGPDCCFFQCLYDFPLSCCPFPSPSLPSEAMSSAALFNCLYLEISASLDHRTPELLECAVRLARGQPPWPPGTSAEDMSGDGQRESITSRAKRFLTSLVPRYPREREVGRFLRQKSRSCHDLGALW